MNNVNPDLSKDSGRDLTIRIACSPGFFGKNSCSDSLRHAYVGPSFLFRGYGKVVLRLPPRTYAIASRLISRACALSGTCITGPSVNSAKLRGTD